jgi:hypothetical protein
MFDAGIYSFAAAAVRQAKMWEPAMMFARVMEPSARTAKMLDPTMQVANALGHSAAIARMVESDARLNQKVLGIAPSLVALGLQQNTPRTALDGLRSGICSRTTPRARTPAGRGGSVASSTGCS